MFYQKKCLMEVSTKDVLTEDKLEDLDVTSLLDKYASLSYLLEENNSIWVYY